jgi:hypothetical protein
MIYHNDPSKKNRYGGTICAESYDDFMKGRILQKVVRTNAKNSDIIKICRKHKYERWDSMLFNCEDFVLEVVEGHRRSDLEISGNSLLWVLLHCCYYEKNCS